MTLKSVEVATFVCSSARRRCVSASTARWVASCRGALALGLGAALRGDALLLLGLPALLLRDLLLALGLGALLVGDLSLPLGLGALPLGLFEGRLQLRERRLAVARVAVGAARLFERAVALRERGDRERAEQQEDDGRHRRRAHESPAVGRALALHLCVGHVGDDPVAVEDVAVDSVAHAEASALGARDAGEAQRVDDGVGLVVGRGAARAHALVEVEQRDAVGLAAQQALAHEEQVVVALARAVREEQLLAQPVYSRR
jgi:hypothetical protein